MTEVITSSYLTTMWMTYGAESVYMTMYMGTTYTTTGAAAQETGSTDADLSKSTYQSTTEVSSTSLTDHSTRTLTTSYLTTMYMYGELMTMYMGTTYTTTDGVVPTTTNTDTAVGTMMMMNQYFNNQWDNYPVLFKQFYAHTAAACFGIFVVLFATAYAFRLFSYIHAYLDQYVFIKTETAPACPECEGNIPAPKKTAGTVLKAVFFPGAKESAYDVVRLILYFLTALLGYCLMLGAMTYVLVYFFAVCLGLAFSDLFFFRWGRAKGHSDTELPKGEVHG